MGFDDDFDKTFNRISGAVIFMFIMSGIVSIGFLVFLFWLASEILEKV